jgi:hypothetical protein
MELKELLRLRVTVAPPVSAGDTPGGELRVIPFTGGTFEGDGVRGTILPGGTDWQVVRSDGVLEIRAHYLLETEQGERIEVISEGIRHAPPGVLDRIAAGEYVPWDQYYFRTAIRLKTAAARLDHLNRVLCISVGERTVDAVALIVYAVP